MNSFTFQDFKKILAQFPNVKKMGIESKDGEYPLFRELYAQGDFDSLSQVEFLVELEDALEECPAFPAAFLGLPIYELSETMLLGDFYDLVCKTARIPPDYAVSK